MAGYKRIAELKAFESQKNAHPQPIFLPPVEKGWKRSKYAFFSENVDDMWEEMKMDKGIESVHFSLMGAEEIRRLSTVRIYETAIYDSNLPHPHGILDHRMGTPDRRMRCGTCGNSVEHCNGHPGHIELPFPMYHVGYIDMVLKILRMCCFWCSRLLIANDYDKLRFAFHHAGIKVEDDLLADIQHALVHFEDSKEDKDTSKEENEEKKERVKKFFQELKTTHKSKMDSLFQAVTQASKGKKTCSFCNDGPQPLKYTRVQHNKTINILCEFAPETSSPFRWVKSQRDVFFESGESDEAFWKSHGFPNGIFSQEHAVKSGFMQPDEYVIGIFYENEDETKGSKTKLKKKMLKSVTFGPAPPPPEECKIITKASEEGKKVKTSKGKRLLRIGKNENKPILETEDERAMVRRVFSQFDAYMILKNIRTCDCFVMGLDPAHARPENMMITALLVGPPIIRPSIAVSEGSRAKGQDDMTQKLQYILKSTVSVQKQLEMEIANVFEETGSGPSPVLQKLLDELQYHVATHINNNLRGVKAAQQRSGAPMKSITCRLRGKRGRIRENMMGKRVDFSARSTISPEDRIAVDEIGLPESFASKLTKAVKVKSDNIAELTRMVRLGPDHPQGAVEVQDNKGLVTDLSMPQVRSTLQLEIGWVVERRLRNGDWVIVNRQPSLHKMSMMAHKVRIMPGRTIRLHPSATTPYNADYDGDEMNIHVPRDDFATNECEDIICVMNQLVTPQSNRPVFGVVQDGISGSYLMTRKECFLEKEVVMDLMMRIMMSPGAGKLGPKSPMNREIKLPPPAIIKPKPLWTGKQIFSLILPDTLFLEKHVRGFAGGEDEVMDDKERFVSVVNGELLCGALCKQTLGSVSNGFIHRLFLDFGPERAARFLTDVHQLVDGFLSHRGFSIGMSDCVISKEARKRIRDACAECEEGVVQLAKRGRKLGLSESEMEPGIKRNLDNILSIAGKIVQSELDDSNRFHVMVVSGAKGSIVNETQVMGCVGQTSVEGKRICATPGMRLLPSIKHGDDAPTSRGLVSDCYVDGVSPDSNYFHAMGAREGLVDTAVKTAETGYSQRRLIKGMETVSQTYDGTIRNSIGDILQFSYGCDGMDATFLEAAQIPFLVGDFVPETSNEIYQNSVGCKATNLISERLPSLYDFETYRKMCVETLKDARKAKTHVYSQKMGGNVYLPFNAGHILSKAKQRTSKQLILQPNAEMLNMEYMIQNLLEVVYFMANMSAPGMIDFDRFGFEVSAKSKDFEKSSEFVVDAYGLKVTTFARAHMLMTLLPSKLKEVSRMQFDWMMKEIKGKFQRAMVQAGEMVGAISAQSLAAPIMQMTLNSFHSAGLTTKAVTMGVPRVKELIDVSKKPSSRSMTVPLKEPFCNHENTAKTVQIEMEHKLLKDVVESSEIVADVPIDQIEMEVNPPETVGTSRFCIKLVFDTKMMQHFNLKPAHVADMITSFFDAQEGASSALGKIIETNQKMVPKVASVSIQKENLLIRLSLLKNMVERNGIDEQSRHEMERTILQKILNCMLTDVHLGGMEAISKAFVVKRGTTNVIETNGSSLLGLMGMDMVDWENTVCNDVYETAETLGIEAAGNVLFYELGMVLMYDGSYINARHPMILVDTMTHRGWLMPMTRHGINRVGAGPLEEASFEETNDRLFSAAIFSEVQEVKGVTPNVMLGKTGDFGTGIPVVLPDPTYKALLDERIRTSKRPKVVKTTIFESLPVEEEYQQNEDWMDENVELEASEFEELVKKTDFGDSFGIDIFEPLHKKETSSLETENFEIPLTKPKDFETPICQPYRYHELEDALPEGLPLRTNGTIPISRYHAPVVRNTELENLLPKKRPLEEGPIAMSNVIQKQTNCVIFQGGDGTGNIIHPVNMDAFASFVKSEFSQGAQLVTADGGTEVDDPNAQEEASQHLILGEVVTTLKTCAVGGNAVIKVFDLFSEFSVCLLYMLCNAFERVNIFKPYSSRPCSSEKYLVLEKYIGVDDFTLPDPKSIPNAFWEQIIAFNEQYAEFQIDHLERAIAMAETIAAKASDCFTPDYAKVAYGIRKMHRDDPTALERAQTFCQVHRL